MSEFIGSRISLISKSDIKYVGTLHEINSETSTVALENVRSYGTEGRRGNPEEEIGPNDQIYDYIVFRGSDVKDLTIVETPNANKPPPPPQMPNDPAILGAARPHPGAPAAPGSAPQQPSQAVFQQPPQGQQWRGPQPPPFSPYGYPPPPQSNPRFAPPGGPHGFPAGPGAPPGYGMQYGPPPPGWFPPAHGFPQPNAGPFPPQPIGPPGLQNQQKPSGSASQQQTPAEEAARPSELEEKPSPSVQTSNAGPPPPVESKPDVSAALAPAQQSQPKPTPSGPRNNRVAVPLASPNVRAQPQPGAASSAPLQAKPGNASASQGATAQSATQAAAAAVAAAMAKLGPVQPTDGAVDNLTKRVGEMRTDDRSRNSRQPGASGYASGHRGGGRGGRRPSTQHQAKPVEVPNTDFDFEASNAKFDKQDMVKEAIASGEPLGTATGDQEPANGTAENESNGHQAHDDVVIPKETYNKSTSFFDNISSELKDRKAAQEDGKRVGGMEFRSEERKKNFETFGQGSVDNGFRGGFRGRGRGGRGFGGGRGRGGFAGGRGGYVPRGGPGVGGANRGGVGRGGSVVTES